MLSRKSAIKLLELHNTEPNLISHARESEAVLRALALHLNEDELLWGITGLLHDLDYSMTKTNPQRHGLDSMELLSGRIPDVALCAIARHAFEMNGYSPPKTQFDYALRCGETVTGLVHAGALVRPTKIHGLKAKSLKKKMKDKAFAASINRDCIRECENIGIELSIFLQLAIDAIADIATQVGLAHDEQSS